MSDALMVILLLFCASVVVVYSFMAGQALARGVKRIVRRFREANDALRFIHRED